MTSADEASARSTSSTQMSPPPGPSASAASTPLSDSSRRRRPYGSVPAEGPSGVTVTPGSGVSLAASTCQRGAHGRRSALGRTRLPPSRPG